MTYTTEQLIQFLEAEQKACNTGQRTFPLPENADEKAVEIAGFMGAFLGAEKLLQVGAYHDYRDQIHQYQRDHQVSGVVIETVELPNGKTIRFPEQDYQLILVGGDMDVLKASKERVVEAFVDAFKSGFYYLSHTIYSKEGGEWSMETTIDFIQSFAMDMEWATISVSNGIFGNGFSLCVGYGEPNDAGLTDCKHADNWFFDAHTDCSWSGPPVKAEVVTLSMADIVKMRKEREQE